METVNVNFFGAMGLLQHKVQGNTFLRQGGSDLKAQSREIVKLLYFNTVVVYQPGKVGKQKP